MASPLRNQAHLLIEELQESCERFDPFWALRLLENCYSDLPRIGTALRLDREFVRLGQRPFTAFAPAALQEFQAGSVIRPTVRPHRLYLSCFGLLGPNGPMPLSVTELAFERQGRRDFALARFLDLLQNRFAAFFYRAWAVNQRVVDSDRPGPRRFTFFLAALAGRDQALAGLGREAAAEAWGQDAVGETAKLHYAQRLTAQARNAEGLRALLADYFGLEVQVLEFTGVWIDLPEANRCRLGADPDSASLGRSTFVGGRVWDCQQTLTIRVGPVSWADFERMLPGGDSFQRLRCWVLNYVGWEYRVRLQLVPRADAVPAIRLGARAGQQGRLGRTTWLKTRTAPADPDDFTVDIT
jgi:type VI secretion system protein ImpH